VSRNAAFTSKVCLERILMAWTGADGVYGCSYGRRCQDVATWDARRVGEGQVVRDLLTRPKGTL
jgi:hypothetical protein